MFEAVRTGDEQHERALQLLPHAQVFQGHDVFEQRDADQVTEFIAPNGFIGVSVFERDPLSSQQIGLFRVPCRPVATQRDVSGGGAFYRVSYVVTQLP